MAAERIDNDVINVVDRYLSVELVKELNADIGWRANHVFGQIIDYLGELPEMHNPGNSNGTMIYQIGLMFNQPKDEKTKFSCAAMTLLEKQSERKHLALVGYVFYRNRPDVENDKDYHTNERIGQLVGMSRSAFDNNLKAAESFIKDIVALNRLKGQFEERAA